MRIDEETKVSVHVLNVHDTNASSRDVDSVDIVNLF
jgi:hypothetical protein